MHISLKEWKTRAVRRRASLTTYHAKRNRYPIHNFAQEHHSQYFPGCGAKTALSCMWRNRKESREGMRFRIIS